MFSGLSKIETLFAWLFNISFLALFECAVRCKINSSDWYICTSVKANNVLRSLLKSAFHLSELTGQTIPVGTIISLSIKTLQSDQSNPKYYARRRWFFSENSWQKPISFSNRLVGHWPARPVLTNGKRPLSKVKRQTSGKLKIPPNANKRSENNIFCSWAVRLGSSPVKFDVCSGPYGP